MGAATAVLWVDGHRNLLHASDYGLSVTRADKIDYHILPNTLTTQHYANALGGQQWVIPQHDSNAEGFRKANVTAPVRVIGWQGNPVNRMSPVVRVSPSSSVLMRCLTIRFSPRAPSHAWRR